MAYFVVRIAGQVKNRKKDNETLKRLKMGGKFSAVFVEGNDAVKMGMVKSVAHMVAYGKVGEDFVKVVLRNGRLPVFVFKEVK